MNLLCPNCQKMLTVPEQYAGQLMKCPLCAGTFTVPALPPAAPPNPEPPPAPPPSPPGPPPSTTNQDVYNLRHEPAAPPSPPPAPPPTSTTTTPTTPTTPADAPAPSPPPAGYTKTHTLWLSPRVLQWVPPVAVVLIFFLQFFTWVGVYPGGIPSVAQGAWSSAFGVLDDNSQIDPDLNQEKFGREFDYPVFEFKPRSADKPSPVVVGPPGASVFSVFYVLLFILVNLPLTIAVIVLPFLKLKLPPPVERLLPYRWGLVTILNLVTFLFLVAQLLVGFSIENAVAVQADKKIEAASAGTSKTTVERKHDEVDRGRFVGAVKRTFWLRLVFWLHVLTVVTAALMYWLTQRGESRPLPKFEMAY